MARRLFAIAPALALAVALAGCAERFDELRGVKPAPEPFFKEYHDSVAAQQDRAYEVTLDERATTLTANLTLLTKTGGVASDAAAPAQLTVQVLTPKGEVLQGATVNAQDPSATLKLDDPSERGTYSVRVTGLGVAAPSLTGESLGAAYLLTIEILYR